MKYETDFSLLEKTTVDKSKFSSILPLFGKLYAGINQDWLVINQHTVSEVQEYQIIYQDQNLQSVTLRLLYNNKGTNIILQEVVTKQEFKPYKYLYTAEQIPAAEAKSSHLKAAVDFVTKDSRFSPSISAVEESANEPTTTNYRVFAEDSTQILQYVVQYSSSSDSFLIISFSRTVKSAPAPAPIPAELEEVYKDSILEVEGEIIETIFNPLAKPSSSKLISSLISYLQKQTNIPASKAPEH